MHLCCSLKMLPVDHPVSSPGHSPLNSNNLIISKICYHAKELIVQDSNLVTTGTGNINRAGLLIDRYGLGV